MSAPLFDPVEQQQRLPQYESVFQFLQRGGRAEAIPIRQWMEKAFRGVAADRRHQLRQRLKDSAFPGFISAYFELQVHEILRRLQCPFDYQPDEPGNYPADFRVTQADKCFGIEAKTFVRDLRLNEGDFVERIRSNNNLVEKLRRRGLSPRSASKWAACRRSTKTGKKQVHQPPLSCGGSSVPTTEKSMGSSKCSYPVRRMAVRGSPLVQWRIWRLHKPADTIR